MDFKIVSITGQGHDTGYGGYPFKVLVNIEVDPKKLAKLKGDLGSLVVSVNNAVYALNPNIPAHNPSIDSKGSKRAKNGIRSMQFVYFFKDVDKAVALGFKGFWTKNGEFVSEYSQYVAIYENKA